MKSFKNNIHPCFKINGYSISAIDISELGYSYIKEGAEFEKSIGQFLLDWVDNSPQIVVQTSGSTGTPKSIRLQKEHMVNSALATGRYFELSANDTALLCLPATYIAGKMMLVRAMVLGLNIHIVPPTSDPLTKNTGAFDFGAMVPLQVLNSISNLHRVKILLIGGAPVSADLRSKLKNIGNYSYETYGMTETITHIAVKRINGFDEHLGEFNFPFEVLPDISISTDDRNCLLIDAPKVSDFKIVTNDVVELISSSQFKWLGRFDNIINSGGVKLNPELIESKLSNVLSGSFFIASLPDPILGEQLVLILEAEEIEELVVQKINTSTILTKFEKPKAIEVISEFVRTKSGKINRRETKALLKSSLP
ncbi:AMP-binding protein [Maribacter sp. X9]|uniref:AMP-binding protein n=1 Tax=Maribacter sp. X9 TaxID=3402159 RepID=UPI003AF378A0